MILPTPSEVVAIKADARKRFGSDRCLCVQLSMPIDAAVVVAPFDYKSYSAHTDARNANRQMAQIGAVVDRVLWCSPVEGLDATLSPLVDTVETTMDDPSPLRRIAIGRVEALSDMWPVLSSEVEGELRVAARQKLGAATMKAQPLTHATAPHKMPANKVTELLSKAPKAGAGSMWSVVDENGCNLVLRCPTSDAYLAMRAAFQDAISKSTAIMDSTLVLGKQLVEWSPEPIDAYFDAHPGYAEGLWSPLLEMGGAATQSHASFL